MGDPRPWREYMGEGGSIKNEFFLTVLAVPIVPHSSSPFASNCESLSSSSAVHRSMTISPSVAPFFQSTRLSSALLRSQAVSEPRLSAREWMEKRTRETAMEVTAMR
jgi:hypothetical protein